MRFSMLLATVILSATIISGCTTSPLHNAIVLKDTNKAAKLIGKDSSIVNKEDDQGRTPLVLASRYTREELVRSLLDAGADPNVVATCGTTALAEASYKGYIPIIDLLLKYGAKTDQPQKYGMSPLHYAVMQNFYSVTKLLIKHGANLNSQNENGSAPLHIASSNGNTAIVKLLLIHGANPDLQDKDGVTPLMFAVSSGSKTIAEDLLHEGADTQLLSKDNKKAEDFAEEKGFPELTSLFKSGSIASDTTIRISRNQPKLIIKEIGNVLNGKETPPGSFRALELRSSIGHFMDMLCESGKFGEVDTLDETNENDDALFFSLSIREIEDKNTGTNVTKAFFTGLLTIGIIPPSADYGYRSELTLVAEYRDGKKKEYRASADTTASWREVPVSPAYMKKSQSAGESARKLVTHQAFESLISQLEEDSFISQR